MEIQQHDGVVVEVAGSRQGFAKRKREGEVSREGEGGARGGGAAALPPPTIYRGPGGVPAPWTSHLRGGAAAKGVACPPSQVGRPPPLGFPTLGAGGGPRGAHQPTRGWFPSHFSPCGPPG